MSKIVFYEKPGCQNQARQKKELRAAGHELEVRDLLSSPWQAETLRPFFGDRPVAEWFNRAAPRVKSGEVVPETIDDASALALMIADPLLIRRPLMRVDQHSVCGYDEISQRILWISTGQGDYAISKSAKFETCTRSSTCLVSDRVSDARASTPLSALGGRAPGGERST